MESDLCIKRCTAQINKIMQKMSMLSVQNKNAIIKKGTWIKYRPHKKNKRKDNKYLWA